jgi:hypothetical protein
MELASCELRFIKNDNIVWTMKKFIELTWLIITYLLIPNFRFRNSFTIPSGLNIIWCFCIWILGSYDFLHCLNSWIRIRNWFWSITLYWSSIICKSTNNFSFIIPSGGDPIPHRLSRSFSIFKINNFGNENFLNGEEIILCIK